MSRLDEILAERERWRKFDVSQARWDGFAWGIAVGVLLTWIALVLL